MANAALPPGALAKPDTGRQRRAEARRQATADRSVYAYVRERDGLRCRACGTYAGVDAHCHHLRGRNFTTKHDVCCLCDECHGFLHVRVGGKLMKLSGDADQRNARGVLNGLTLQTRNNDGTWRTEAGL